jgi:hypothetical protein
VDNADLHAVAREAKARLQRVVSQLAAAPPEGEAAARA